MRSVTYMHKYICLLPNTQYLYTYLYAQKHLYIHIQPLYVIHWNIMHTSAYLYVFIHTLEYLILLLIHTFIFVDLSLSHILIYTLRNIFVIRYFNNVHFNFIKMHIGLFILFVVNITLVTIHVILLLYKLSNTYLISHYNPPYLYLFKVRL